MTLRRAVAAVVVVVAILATGAGWLQSVPDLTAADAALAAAAAFDAAGVPAEIDGMPSAEGYATRDGGALEVWRVRLSVRSASVDVLLARAGARAVAIDDRAPNGAAYVLSEGEYDSVAAGVEDPGVDRALQRNLTLTLAAIAVIAVALALVATTEPEPPR